MIESGMNDGIGHGSARRQRLRLLQRTAMGNGPDIAQLHLAGVRTRQANHLMPCRNQFWDDARTDEAGRASQKDTHG